MGAANVINKGYAPVLRAAGWHQTDTGLLYTPPTMRIPSPPSSLGAVTEVLYREGLVIRRFELQNLNASVVNCGVGSRTANAHWTAGLYDGATYTDKTALLQSRTPTKLGVDGADNTGWVILSDRPFDWVSMDITTAGVSAAADHSLQYSVAGGSWTTIAASMVLTDGYTATDTPLALAVHDVVWEKQPEWAKTDTHTGLQAGKYAMRFVTAGSAGGNTVAIASGVEIGEAFLLKSLAVSGIWETEEIDYWMPAGDGIVAYFSVITIANRVYAEVLTR
jgi:hypothetical protein